jgi:cobalamin biosynthetic protein CobC
MAGVPITGRAIPEPVAHGGDLGAVRRRFPNAPLPWIDLSTGINPVAYPVAALPPDAWSRLPSRDVEQALIAAAARRYGAADPATIVAAPGTQALIQLVPRLVPTSRVAIVGATYAEHELCWRRAGHDIAVVSDLAGAAGFDVVIVVNPDNPTGRLIPPQALRLVETALLVVDEAFIDFLPPEASLAGDLPANAIVLRSFGKTFGLAGVRLGFAVAPARLARRLRDELGPWAVSGPALEIGRAALGDEAWLQAAATRLASDQQRLDMLLVSTGFTVLGGTTLFRLASHPEARRMADRLGAQGIHVRAFEHQPLWLRFGLPADENGFRRLHVAFEQHRTAHSAKKVSSRAERGTFKATGKVPRSARDDSER